MIVRFPELVEVEKRRVTTMGLNRSLWMDAYVGIREWEEPTLSLKFNRT